jgi:uncharacterized protein (DUF3084 family)
MKNLSLILRIVAIVAAIGAAALFFLAQGKLEEKQVELEKAQAANIATQAELGTANEQVASLETRIAAERESLADTKRKLEAVRSEMYTAKQEVTRTQQQLSIAKTQALELEDTTRRLRSDLVKTEQTLASTSKEAELAQLNERISELEKANDTLKQVVSAAQVLDNSRRSSAQRSDNTVTAASYSQSLSASTGSAVQPASIGAETTVASISLSDGILILNNRPELGLTPGVEVSLIQDLKALGKVRVNKISGNYVIANILPGTTLRSLDIGDAVKLLR